jgi:hypothetical protein
VSLPALAFVSLDGEVAEAVLRVPPSAGVGEILGPEGRSLLLAGTSNLRRWAASHLGLSRPPAAGRRPRTNLAGIATAIGWARADAPFRQRLLFERLSARHVPLSARRDLKPPVFLHLDPAQRFPRVAVRGAENPSGALFGPFRDRRAAERARDAVHRLFPLRPCDYSFVPDPALPLGLSCLYAQVRSCAAPCLARVGEEEYRGLAARAAAWLASPSAREDSPQAVPPWVGAGDARAVVVDAGKKEVGLYPVRAGRVLDAASLVVARSELDDAVASLRWSEADRFDDDWPWLVDWLRTASGRASYVLVSGDGVALANAVRAALSARSAARGGNVGPAQEEE